MSYAIMDEIKRYKLDSYLEKQINTIKKKYKNVITEWNTLNGVSFTPHGTITEGQVFLIALLKNNDYRIVYTSLRPDQTHYILIVVDRNKNFKCNIKCNVEQFNRLEMINFLSQIIEEKNDVFVPQFISETNPNYLTKKFICEHLKMYNIIPKLTINNENKKYNDKKDYSINLFSRFYSTFLEKIVDLNRIKIQTGTASTRNLNLKIQSHLVNSYLLNNDDKFIDKYDRVFSVLNGPMPHCFSNKYFIDQIIKKFRHRDVYKYTKYRNLKKCFDLYKKKFTGFNPIFVLYKGFFVPYIYFEIYSNLLEKICESKKVWNSNYELCKDHIYSSLDCLKDFELSQRKFENFIHHKILRKGVEI